MENQFIAIDEEIYEINTDAEIEAAKRAMAQAGIKQAKVYTGECDPECVETGQILFV